MNGPTNHQSREDKNKGMYKVKKAFQLPDDIPVPQCMYKIKQLPPEIGAISSSKDCTSAPQTNGQEYVASSAVSPKRQDQSNSKTPPDGKMGKKKGPTSTSPVVKSDAALPDSDNAVKSLEERQLEIIKKLERLRDVITAIHSSSLSQDSGSCPPLNFTDAVINADPKSPPYSVLFFKKLLAKLCGYNVSMSTHLHSSYNETLPPNLHVFDSQSSDEKTHFNVTLIWRKLDHKCDLMISPICQIPIRGEANICRFFSRLLPENSALNYDALDLESLMRVDEKLDCLSKGTFTLDCLEKSLKSAQPYILGEVSLADLVCFSEAATMLLHSQKGISSYPNISGWIKNCQDLGDVNVFKL